MEKRESVMLITGASSGIGNACATFFAKKGQKVYGACRSPSSYLRKADEFFELIALDQRDQGSVSKAAEKLLSVEGHIDTIIASAGYGQAGSIEETDLADAQALFETDFFGTLRLIKTFLPSMREQKSGKILILCGMEGQLPIPFQGLYSAAQAALLSLGKALRLELAGFGIQVGVVELGSYKTAFAERRFISQSANSAASPYKRPFDNLVGVMEREEAKGGEPLEAVKVIHSMLEAKRLPGRRVSGQLGWRLLEASSRYWGSRAAQSRLRSYFRLDR